MDGIYRWIDEHNEHNAYGKRLRDKHTFERFRRAHSSLVPFPVEKQQRLSITTIVFLSLRCGVCVCAVLVVFVVFAYLRIYAIFEYIPSILECKNFK